MAPRSEPVKLRWPPAGPAAPGSSSTTSSTPAIPITTIRSASRRRSCGSWSARDPLAAGPAWPAPPDPAARVVTARSRVDRDLVLALRSELAAIDPARACDRRALALGIGRTTTTRDPVLARLAIRLGLGSTRDPRGAEGGEAFAWGQARDHCRAAYLRGLFLAHGSLSLANGRTHLEFVVEPGQAPLLAAHLAEEGLPASWRIRRGRGVVTWKSAETIVTFLRRAGAGGGAPRARGAPGLAGDARRAQPGHQRRIGQPPGRSRRPDATWRRSRPRRRRPAGGAAVCRPARGRRAPGDARSRRSPSSPNGSGSTGRPSSGRSSGSSGWHSTTMPAPGAVRPRRTSSARPGRARSGMMRRCDVDRRGQLEDAHHPVGGRRARRHDRRADRGRRRRPGHLPAVRRPGRRPRRARRDAASPSVPRTSTRSCRARTPAR